MHIKKKEIQGWWLVAYLLCYIFSNGVFGADNAWISTLIKAVVILGLVLIQYKNNRSINIGTMKLVVQLLLVLIVLQLFFIQNIVILKILGLNILTFYLLACRTSEDSLKYLSFGVKLCAIIASCSVVYLSLAYGSFYYFRDESFIDKSYITAFYSMSYIYIFIDITYNKNRLFNFITLLFLLLTNILIVQSKISLSALFIGIIAVYLFSNKEQKLKYRKFLSYCLVAILILVVIFPDITLPDEIKYAVNFVFKSDIFTVERSVERLNMTYDIRGDLWNYCIKNLFMTHPILGIGLGNFETYSKMSRTSWAGLPETESSLLSIITEGGIVYTIIMFFFFYFPINLVYKKIRKERKIEYLYVLLFFTTYLVMIVGNDFLDSFFWCQAAIMIGTLYKTARNNNRYYIE